MKEMFVKEFVINTDPEIESLYFGALPSEGRYFTKKCEKIGEGMFRVKITAPKGDLYYHYKIEGDWGRILLDPNNFQIGAKNWHSICRLGTTSFNQIEFAMEQSYISQITEKELEIKIIAHQQWIKEIRLLILNEKEAPIEIQGDCILNIETKKYFKFIIDKNVLEGKNFCFKVLCQNNTYYYGKNMQLSDEINDYFTFHSDDFPYSSPINVNTVYQIFPDSFAKDKVISVENRKIISTQDAPESNAFYGGNIRGIINKLDYLYDLGIRCIYLTPIFYANSNDRYDCIDYTKIDPMLGSKEDFAELCKEAHKRKIKIVLDIVLNHCGTDFWMFKDVMEKQEESEYLNYFEIYRFPIKYESYRPNYSCWWDMGNMPQFNLKNEKTVEYLFECCKYWIKEYDIDGWRIDVSSELEHDLLKRFRKEMKECKESIILIGENWKDARNFLEGDELDGVTNYLTWWKAFEPYFCKKSITLTQFADALVSSYFLYMHNRSISNWNVISSHDVPRFFSSIKDLNDVTNIIVTQIFIPGIPVVYYGDEVMLEGGDTPDNRKAMPWDKVDTENDALRLYKTMLQIRNQKDVLKYGDFSVPYLNEELQVLCLKRTLNDESIYCILNFSENTIHIKLQDLNIKRNCSYVYDNSSVGDYIIVPSKGFQLLSESHRIE